MAKIITQETYDDVVKENIVEFSMSVQEAKEETVKQFEAQGINLANIIKDLNLNEETGAPIMTEAIDFLRNASGKEDCGIEKIRKNLDLLTEECRLTVPHKVLAAKLGSYDLVLEMLDADSELTKKIKNKAVIAGNAMINKQPDIFNAKSLKVLIKILENENDKELLCNSLKWLQKACVLHEINRQNIMNENAVLELLKKLLTNDEAEVVKETCTAIRCLILDDDIRVEFGKAHEHARTIANESLKNITLLLTKFKGDQDLICELFLTLASLTVRHEFCEVIENAGGVKFTMDAMVEYPESMRILREAMKLLKALAGNDAVKVLIIQCGAAPLIESALNCYKDNEAFARHALACVSTLALRDKDNATALFETGIAETIIQTMKIHDTNKVVQRNGAWSIRNMVSRSREQCDSFISLGVEDVLNTALAQHPTIAQDIKAALRDLGCKVILIEEWKGKSEIEIKND